MLKTYFSYPRLPSWTGGVPRQMSEANLGRRGGGFPTDRNPVILSEAKELGPPPRLQTLASLGLDPPLLSRRGVFW